MAIDTAEKRFSMTAFGDADGAIMFEVDGSVDLDDRQHLLGCYSGIAFNSVAIVAPDSPGIQYQVPDGRLHFSVPDERLHFTAPDGRIQFRSIPPDDED